MTRYELLQEVKTELKTWSKKIRALKLTRKFDKRDGRSLEDIEADIWNFKHKYRHQHIAYCEFRGKTREQIERPAEGNYPNETTISRLKTKWTEKIDEDVCVVS